MAHGKIIIKLDKLMKEKRITKTKLCFKAEMQRTQLNNYCNNITTRFDSDVLARLCSALDCEIGDILEFVPDKKTDE
ncbi:MAG: helix-turn-helix domain-containing protein [Lachnospiraceae bacterium]